MDSFKFLDALTFVFLVPEMILTSLCLLISLLTLVSAPALTPTPPLVDAPEPSPQIVPFTSPLSSLLPKLSHVHKRESKPPFPPHTPSLSAPQTPQRVIHRVKSLDCRHPVHQRTTPLSEACSTPDSLKQKISDIDTKNYVIVQRTTGHSRKAVRCQKQISQVGEICGKWGHTKLVSPPTILLPVTITEEECQILVTNRLYQDEKRVMHAVPTDDYRYTSVTHGSLHYSTNDVRCTGGGAIEIAGRVIEDIVILRETVLQIRHVIVTIDDEKIEDETTGEMLTDPCATGPTCLAGKAVYVFEGKANPCAYSKVRQEDFVVYQTDKKGQIQSWARQDEHHLLFQLQEKVPAPAMCEKSFSYSFPTQFKEIHLVESKMIIEPDQFRTVEGYQVDLELEEKVTSSYERYILQHELLNATQDMAKQLCLLARDSWSNELTSPFHPLALLRVRGEVLQELLCSEVEVSIIEGDSLEGKCFHQSLPVLKGGEHLLMRANTRLLIEPSPLEEVPCTHLSVPLFLVGTSVLTADPQVRSLTLPMSQISLSALHPLPVELQASAFSEALLYTHAEVTNYLSLVHHKAAHQTVTHALTREFCGRSRSCGAYTPPSGLLGFDSLVNSIDPETWFEEGLAKIKAFGAYCSIIVVLYLIFSLLQVVFNFGRFKFGHGYALRDALQLALNPADLVARYADRLHQADHDRGHDTARE